MLTNVPNFNKGNTPHTFQSPRGPTTTGSSDAFDDIRVAAARYLVRYGTSAREQDSIVNLLKKNNSRGDMLQYFQLDKPPHVRITWYDYDEVGCIGQTFLQFRFGRLVKPHLYSQAR